MIASLRGRLVGREGARGVFEVQGVGWEVFSTARAFESWSSAHEDVTAFVSTQVRDDAIQLFGFATDLERRAFEVVMSVDGFGPRLALSTLDAVPLADLHRAIESDDARTLARIPGVGSKKAQRLLLELKGKLPVGFEVGEVGRPKAAKAEDPLPLALAQLEYGRSEIDRALAALVDLGVGPDQPLPDRLKAALGALASRR